MQNAGCSKRVESQQIKKSPLPLLETGIPCSIPYGITVYCNVLHLPEAIAVNLWAGLLASHRSFLK
ncbi:uncharacterized protein Dvar_73730 [Desulfosarcina variabilis str. Montpellier]